MPRPRSPTRRARTPTRSAPAREIRYQQPSGEINHLKTLETDANAIKAAILLYQATGQAAYLQSATSRYDAVRSYFLARVGPLYTVYVFDDGTTCTQVPQRFFASVNGDMIWNGVELAKLTGGHSAISTRRSRPGRRSRRASPTRPACSPTSRRRTTSSSRSSRGCTRSRPRPTKSIRAELDPLERRRRLSARTADGSFGRFFDGPPPQTTITAWQTNGGLALEIAAAALAPSQTVPLGSRWAAARKIARSVGPTGTIRFTGSGIALLGTLGEVCCESGHAQVLVDGQGDLRRDRDLAEQVEPRPEDPGHDPLRLALAEARARTRSASRRACRTGRRAPPSYTSAGTSCRRRAPAHHVRRPYQPPTTQE